MACGVRVANHTLGGAEVSWWPMERWEEAGRPHWRPGTQQKPCRFRKAVSIRRRGTKGPGDCTLDIPQHPLDLTGPRGNAPTSLEGFQTERWELETKGQGQPHGRETPLPLVAESRSNLVSAKSVWGAMRASGNCSSFTEVRAGPTFGLQERGV